MEKSGTSLKGSQLITFCLSLAAAFVAAVQAFYNPVRRWQQVRDATAYRFSSTNYHSDGIGLVQLTTTP